ncbi:cupin domain-containing protein [Paraburkholderia phytofirmans]|uniref:Cupin 2 conserved barrel domain protein n=1 Tax=Paraburkholderia phytofirmans (strain DSM 17436 / LMG 22146 / PsJN) TaxID=398527 RepID=B2T8D2_PARPJ|nr:cupin domain-containing protein [Paraburkholderia phytofirmans]ACD20496.1 Cupin 2 conserved barrel domain protein [Paraburkholderia phytofirmans PsJN]
MNPVAPTLPRCARKLAMLALATTMMLALAPSAPRAAIDWFADICGGDSSMSSVSTHAGAASRPASTVKVLSCEALPNAPGKSVTTAIVDFPPLGFTPAHRHPGAVSAVVLEGTIRSQLQGGPPVDYAAGQTWFEPPRALHLFAENPDAMHTAKLLATFIADTNCGPLVLPPD